MAGETTLTVVGNLTDDPELRFTPSGAAVANFTVASTPRTFDRQTNEWVDGDPLFIRCSIWREAAENVAESLTKGMRVVVTGALRVRQYERSDGSKGTSVEMSADEVAPSLKWATAVVTRNQRGASSRQDSRQAARPSGGDAWGTSNPPASDPWASSSAHGEPPF